MNILKKKKGFTLLEILIVLVILGVVAGAMFPVLTAQIEKSRAQEAITALGTVKQAMVTYWQTTGVGAASPNHAGSYNSATFAKLGYDPNSSAAGQAPLFTYSLTVTDDDHFTCTAQRNPAQANPGNTITIDQAGNVVRNGVYQ